MSLDDDVAVAEKEQRAQDEESIKNPAKSSHRGRITGNLKKVMGKYSFQNADVFKKNFIDKVDREPEKVYHISGKSYKQTRKEFEKIHKAIKQDNKYVPDPSSNDLKKTSKNTMNMVLRNGISYFSPVTHYKVNKINKQSIDYLANNPESNRKIVFLQAGFSQNMAALVREAQVHRENGMVPIIKRTYNALDAQKQADKVINYAQKTFDKAGVSYGQSLSDLKLKTIKDAKQKLSGRHMAPNAYFKGHSTGGKVAHAVARHDDASKFFRGVYAVSADQYGVGHDRRTPGQALLMPLDRNSNTRVSKKAQQEAINFYKSDPKIPVYEIAHLQDRLVPPKETFSSDRKIKQTGGHKYLIDHPYASHFGSSGQDISIAQIHSDIIKGVYDKGRQAHHMYSYITPDYSKMPMKIKPNFDKERITKSSDVPTKPHHSKGIDNDFIKYNNPEAYKVQEQYKK